MDLLNPRCAGLDVHKDLVVACARVADGGEVERELGQFGTTTRELLRLLDWLGEHKCTHVAMEATGVYWKPVWHVLEGSFELVLANAQHVKNMPGRKTDVNDATWLADLLAHGLIRPSFVPDTPVQELRDLTRTRKQLVREKGRHVKRIQKVLEDANVKLASVVSDIMGVSGRAIIESLASGETDPVVLLRHASLRLKASRAELVDALRGRVTSHHRFLLRLHLEQITALDTAIARVDEEVGAALKPFRDCVELLKEIPGVGELAAQVIVSEIGFDMSRFATAGHLLSWAGLCPRSDESAGKRRSTRLRQGAPWLKTVLVQAAWAAARSKDTYLRAQFLRLKVRRGPRKAIMAVAGSILTAAYHMLRDGVEYEDLGADYFEKRSAQSKAKAVKRLTRRLEALGYEVALKEAA